MIPSFTLFGRKYYPYSLFMIAGAFACLGLFSLLTVRRHKDKDSGNVFAIEMLIIALAAALPAAMLFDSLFKLGETGKFVFGSATFYGGLIIAIPLYCLLLLIKRKKRTVTILERLADLAPAICIGHCLGRIGCFFGGCCYGAPTHSALGVIFPPGSASYAQYGAVPVHPTQLYEAAFLLLLGVGLLFCKKHSFPLYLIGYGAWRFGIEFLRADDRGVLFSTALSPAQIISIVLFAVGTALEILLLVKQFPPKKKEKIET